MAETSASPDPTPADPVLGPDDVAQVVTTDLVVRSAPGVNEESEIYPQRLAEPTLLFVVDGPVPADGYDWYQVKPFGTHIVNPVDPDSFGWVAAAGKDGEPWIAPGDVVCPEPDVESIRWLSSVARLACYGSETLVLEGRFAGCFAGETPVWLLQNGCMILPTDYLPGAVPDPGGVAMRTVDAVDTPHDRPGSPIVATGHFDDPAASTCGWSENFGDEAGMEVETPPTALVILWCRTEFVVTHIAPG
jgi:hypothetical protein